MKKSKNLYALLSVIILSSGIYLGCSSSSTTTTVSTGTFKGTVSTFTASLETEKKSMFAQLRDFFFPVANAAASGVTITSGSTSATTAADGTFSMDLATGDHTVTFASGGSSATFSLSDVDAGETLEWNSIAVAGSSVSTERTGTYTGTIDGLPTTMSISAGGNAWTVTYTSGGVSGSGSGTENGSTVSGTWANSSGDCGGSSGTVSGTFSGSNLTGDVTVVTPDGTDTCDHVVGSVMAMDVSK